MGRNLGLEPVTAQREVFCEYALYLSQQGLRVNTREGTDQDPACIVDQGNQVE